MSVTRAVRFDRSVVALGQGYDSISGEVKGAALDVSRAPALVNFHERRDDGAAPDAKVSFRLEIVESRAQLKEALDVQGGASLKHGVVSGTLQGKYATMDVESNEKSFVLVKVSVTNSVFTLSPDAINLESKLLTSNRTSRLQPDADLNVSEEEFVKAFGDSFVRSVVTGGELNALLEISAKAGETRRDIEGSLEAEIELAGAGIEGQVSVESNLNKLTKERRVNITTETRGGMMTESPLDVSSLVELAKVFPAMVNGGTVSYLGKEMTYIGNAVPVSMVIMPYTQLDNWPRGSELIDSLAQSIVDDLVEIFFDYGSAKAKLTASIGQALGSIKPDGTKAELNYVDPEKMVLLQTGKNESRDAQIFVLRLLDVLTGQANDLGGAEIRRFPDNVAAPELPDSFSGRNSRATFVAKWLSVMKPAAVLVLENSVDLKTAKEWQDAAKALQRDGNNEDGDAEGEGGILYAENPGSRFINFGGGPETDVVYDGELVVFEGDNFETSLFSTQPMTLRKAVESSTLSGAWEGKQIGSIPGAHMSPLEFTVSVPTNTGGNQWTLELGFSQDHRIPIDLPPIEVGGGSDEPTQPVPTDPTAVEEGEEDSGEISDEQPGNRFKSMTRFSLYVAGDLSEAFKLVSGSVDVNKGAASGVASSGVELRSKQMNLAGGRFFNVSLPVVTASDRLIFKMVPHASEDTDSPIHVSWMGIRSVPKPVEENA